MNPGFKKFAVPFAYEAGAIMKKHFALDMKKEWKKDNSPVTLADFAINAKLIQKIKKAFPNHAVLGEEESHVKQGAEYIWVCDPVDGTIPFSHGIPMSTFSLALTQRGKVILGVVYDPFGDRLFFAEKGKGAFLNGKKIHVSKETDLKRVAANCEMFASAKYDVGKLIYYFAMEKDVKLFHTCSYIYPTMLVAAGVFGFTIFPHTTAHDGATAKIIVEEAGGIVRDMQGNEQKYDMPINGLIASNKAIYPTVLKLVKEFVTLTKK